MAFIYNYKDLYASLYVGNELFFEKICIFLYASYILIVYSEHNVMIVIAEALAIQG
ncbi:hypothetical protein FHS15_003745 [Paenibacillus castaneae]|nr:hypothetical protein [Paenibacillus castaneae]